MTGRGGHLHGRLWIGHGDLRGVVIAIHGLGDHGGRYDELAEQLTQLGWALFAFDLPGHGLSPGGRGRVDSFDGLLADIAAARQTIAQRLPRVPQALLGHSMGGNLAINYLLRRRAIQPLGDDPAGLVLVAPMLLPPKPPQRPHIFAAWLTGHLFPWIRINQPVETGALTSDPEQALAIKRDSLVHSRITIYLATQLLSQGRWALDQAREVDLPTIVLWGEADTLIDTRACEHLAIRIGPRASLVRFPDQRHDLLHETGRQDVFQQLGAWLEQSIG